MVRSLARAENPQLKRQSLLIAVAVVMSIAPMVMADDLGLAAASGFNQYLEDHKGLAFIPQMPQTSGWLGEQVGKRVIGAAADIATFRGVGSNTGGFIHYPLYFDVSHSLTPNGVSNNYTAADISSATINLYLDLHDIDFAHVVGAGRLYYESLELTFVRNDPLFTGVGNVDCPDFDATFPSLLIDDTNYGALRDDGFGPTNNVQATYEVDLSQMGLTAADYQQIIDHEAFRLVVTVSSYTERLAPGVATYRNTKEYFGDYAADGVVNGFGDDDDDPNTLIIDVPVPEPMTLSLMGVGAMALLRRRR